jgi:hypothetical protein
MNPSLINVHLAIASQAEQTARRRFRKPRR